jgi:hypothetical protein
MHLSITTAHDFGGIIYFQKWFFVLAPDATVCLAPAIVQVKSVYAGHVKIFFQVN